MEENRKKDEEMPGITVKRPSAEESHKENDKTDEKKDIAKKVFSEIFDWVEMFAISITLVVIIFTFLFRVAVVDGDSMNKTLTHGEVLLVSRLPYEPKYGDIIIFKTAYNGYTEPFVKRVIAVGGETVDIDFKNWQVYIDGEPVDETGYVNYVNGREMNNSYVGDTQEYPFYIPEGKLFVMGDNRNDSLDSRTKRVDLVDERMIMGKAFIRLMPFSKFGGLY